MPTVHLMEAANLFCGDHDPTASKHLTIQSVKLPDMQELMQDHHAGGAPFQVEFGTGFQKLEATFKLVGFDADLLRQFGLGSRMRHTYTAYEVIQDRQTGRRIENKAIIQARLGKVSREEYSRGNLQGAEYALNEIMHYEFYHDGTRLQYFDFFENEWRPDGDEGNAEINRILRIGGGA